MHGEFECVHLGFHLLHHRSHWHVYLDVYLPTAGIPLVPLLWSHRHLHPRGND